MTMKALQAGKPVLCEKPMTMSPALTKELIDEASGRNLLLMEGVWMRFFPAVVELRHMIEEDDIGEVQFVRATFLFRCPPDRAKGRITDPSLGGGAILELGMYTISLLPLCCGQRPVKIHAQGHTLPNGVDDFAIITLTYEKGGLAQLTCGIVYDLVCDAVICGTKGDLKLPQPFWCPTKLEPPYGVYVKDGVSKEFPFPDPHLPGNYPNPTGLRYEAEEVYECLRAGKLQSDIMPLEQSLIAAEIAEEVMKQLGVIHYTGNSAVGKSI